MSWNFVIIGSGNGLVHIWHQTITWTNADLLLITPLRTNFTEIWNQTQTFSFKKIHIWKCHQQNVRQFVQGSLYQNGSTLILAGLDLNFQGHLSCRTSEIENSPVLHKMTPVRAIIYVIIFLIIDLSCRTSVIIVQPVRGAIFQNFYLSGTVWQSLRSSPAWHGQVNHMPGKVWDEITYPFPNFKSCTVEVWEWIGNFIPHFIKNVITYPYCLVLTVSIIQHRKHIQ